MIHLKIAYADFNFRRSSLELIEKVNSIVNEYQRKGYSLTLRQVYYQLVAFNVVPNTERSYENVGTLISKGRLAGLISWKAIEDRTRNLRKKVHWTGVDEIIRANARNLHYDHWADQDYYVEVWVEKDALIDVVSRACQPLDISYFSCRGYVSQSEMWEASQRIHRRIGHGRQPVIIHLGDHDPSGKDMSRDIQDRLSTFEVEPIFRRIALNMDQIEQYQPPPNPAKLTDTRANGYISKYGYESWELDALRPEVIDELIKNTITEYCDMDRFQEVAAELEHDRKLLRKLSEEWGTVSKQMQEMMREEDEDGDDWDE